MEQLPHAKDFFKELIDYYEKVYEIKLAKQEKEFILATMLNAEGTENMLLQDVADWLEYYHEEIKKEVR